MRRGGFAHPDRPANAINTPMRRMRSRCRALAVIGQVAAAPPRRVMKSRRRIIAPKREKAIT